MPLDATRQKMVATSNTDSIGNLVLPEVPFTPMPATLNRVALEKWNRDNHTALQRWREQVNARLTGIKSV